MELIIQLLSPLCAGSGVGRAGVIDREIIFDPQTGLPLIPGRRLKGLLRDAYTQLYDSGAFNDFALPAPGSVFGEPGQPFPGWLHIGDATLPAALSEPLAALFASSAVPFATHEVLARFASVRRQTAIDRASGTANDDTLRYTRVLNSGLSFSARVTGLDHLAARHAVALAAAGVKRMGVTRSRGLGEVACSLASGPRNLSAEAIALLRAGTPLPAVPPAPVAVPNGTATAQPLTPPSHRLRYHVHLHSAALLPATQQADPNTASSSRVIPGSTIRGLFAHAYLRTNSADARFHELFSSGQTLFLPAPPACQDQSPLAVPFSIRENKRNLSDPPLNLALEDRPRDFQPKRLDKAWFLPDAWEQQMPSPSPEIRTTLHYHHQRAHDPRLQRALGSEDKHREPYPHLSRGQEGALFVYESLLPRQSFLGEILGSPADLEQLQRLLPSASSVQIGRSKSAQYGGEAAWTWLGSIEPLEPIAQQPQSEDGLCMLWLLTPMIAVNKHGHPSAEFPVQELDPKAEIKKAFARREFQGGFLSHQNLPRQQTPSLAAGSTFLISVPPGFDPVAAAQRSYGLRIEEGFGRIAIAAVYPPSQGSLFASDSPPGPFGALASSSPLHSVACDILREQVRQRTVFTARAASDSVANAGAIRPHQLHRLITMLDSGAPLIEVSNLLARTRKTAARQFELVRVDQRTLAEYLTSICSHPGAALKYVMQHLSQTSVRNWTNLLGQSPQDLLAADPDFATAVTRAFLLSFLSALARRSNHAQN